MGTNAPLEMPVPYQQPVYPRPASGNRSRASSTASGRYVPEGYPVPVPQSRPRAASIDYLTPHSRPLSYQPATPDQYVAQSYQSRSQQHHPEPPLPIGDHVRILEDGTRPRRSTESRRSESVRSHRSHHSERSRHSHYDERDRSRHRHYDDDRHSQHARDRSPDRMSVRSKRSTKSGRSHHSHKHFDDDVDAEPKPLKRTDTRRPTLGGSLVSLWTAIKQSLE